ncbi:MAG: arginase family protein [Lachnospiraceae bacterium]|nr:arginase family protein [Lachnospiraceae bacterium]
MNKIQGLSVIECGYCDNGWSVDFSSGVPVYRSSLKPFQKPRETEFFHRSGLYGEAGVPAEIHEINYDRYSQYEPYEGVHREYSDLVTDAVKKGHVVLAVGGYCNYAPAIAGGIRRALGKDKKIGLVWIDAHADCRIAETAGAPVRFVSFPLSTMVGLTMPDFRSDICGLTVPLCGNDVLASDLRIMDEPTAANVEKAGIIVLDGSVFEKEAEWTKKVNELAERVDAIYLSVDADILKFEHIPSYIKRVPFGHDVDVVCRNVGAVMRTGKVLAFSLFCFNFDLYENGGETTFLTEQAIIKAGLENWKQKPEG